MYTRRSLLGALALPVLAAPSLAASGAGARSPERVSVAPQTPVLFEDFDTFDGSAANGQAFGVGAQLALERIDKVHGSAAISVKSNGSSGTASIGYDRTPATLYDPASLGVMAVRTKVTDAVNMSNLAFSLYRGGNPSSFNMQDFRGYPSGWQWQAFDTSAAPPGFLQSGVGPVRRRAGHSGLAAAGREALFDAMYYQCKGRTKVVIGFDDGYKGQLTDAAPVLLALGLPVSLHIENAKLTGAGNPGQSNQRLTVAEVDRLAKPPYNWEILNQGDGIDFTDTATYPSVSHAVNAALAVRSAIISRGWSNGRNIHHMSYPSIGGGAIPQAYADAFAAAGFQTARGGKPHHYYTRFGHDCRRMNYPSVGSASRTTGASLIGAVENAKRVGADVIFHFHDVGPSPSAIGLVTRESEILFSYLAAERAARRIDVMTTADWHDAVAASSPPP